MKAWGSIIANTSNLRFFQTRESRLDTRRSLASYGHLHPVPYRTRYLWIPVRCVRTSLRIFLSPYRNTSLVYTHLLQYSPCRCGSVRFSLPKSSSDRRERELPPWRSCLYSKKDISLLCLSICLHNEQQLHGGKFFFHPHSVAAAPWRPEVPREDWARAPRHPWSIHLSTLDKSYILIPYMCPSLTPALTSKSKCTYTWKSSSLHAPVAFCRSHNMSRPSREDLQNMNGSPYLSIYVSISQWQIDKDR